MRRLAQMLLNLAMFSFFLYDFLAAKIIIFWICSKHLMEKFQNGEVLLPDFVVLDEMVAKFFQDVLRRGYGLHALLTEREKE